MLQTAVTADIITTTLPAAETKLNHIGDQFQCSVGCEQIFYNPIWEQLFDLQLSTKIVLLSTFDPGIPGPIFDCKALIKYRFYSLTKTNKPPERTSKVTNPRAPVPAIPRNTHQRKANTQPSHTR